MSLPCPECKGQNIRTSVDDRRTRARLAGRAVIRHHLCGDCGWRFRSFQVAIATEADAETATSYVEEVS